MSLEIKEILKVAEARLTEAGCEEGKTDAEALLRFLMKFDRTSLFMNWSTILNEKSCDAYFDLVDQRAARKPLQYIVGTQEFMGFSFAVDERVLIPRQDTETLAEAVLAYLRGARRPSNGWRGLDLCTGSGALAVSLCRQWRDLRMTATDVSEGALDAARQNAAAAGVGRRIQFVRSDLFAALRSGFGGRKYHFIVSNPPYVRSGEIPDLQPEIRDHEPRAALDGGPDGLNFYKRMASQAHVYLKKEGVVFLEIGWDQAEAVSRLLARTGKYESPDILRDLAGRDRVLAARRGQKDGAAARRRGG
jgi:release factor glutamine methyltransferase